MARRTGWMMLGLALAWLAAAPAAEAAPRKVSGTVTYVPVGSDVSDLADGRSVARSAFNGIIVADDPTIPFHLAAQDCGGTTIVSADRKTTVGSGYCAALDKDGDAWWLWWRLEGDGSTWAVVDGTGKYKGMTGGGTTKTLVRLPDGRQTIRFEGTLDFK